MKIDKSVDLRHTYPTQSNACETSDKSFYRKDHHHRVRNSSSIKTYRKEFKSSTSIRSKISVDGNRILKAGHRTYHRPLDKLVSSSNHTENFSKQSNSSTRAILSFKTRHPSPPNRQLHNKRRGNNPDDAMQRHLVDEREDHQSTRPSFDKRHSNRSLHNERRESNPDDNTIHTHLVDDRNDRQSKRLSFDKRYSNHSIRQTCNEDLNSLHDDATEGERTKRDDCGEPKTAYEVEYRDDNAREKQRTSRSGKNKNDANEGLNDFDKKFLNALESLHVLHVIYHITMCFC